MPRVKPRNRARWLRNLRAAHARRKQEKITSAPVALVADKIEDIIVDVEERIAKLNFVMDVLNKFKNNRI